MSRFINPVPQYSDDSGDPLISGKAYFFESGTNTPKTTYADVNLIIANPHPVILTASGRMPNVFFDGAAKMKLADGDDVQIFERDPVSAAEVSGSFGIWNSTVIYATSDIVQGSDGLFYKSITSANQGNDPTSVATAWQEIQFLDIWNVNVTYAAGVTVKGSDNLLYRSLAGSNLGNDPTTDRTNWGQAAALVVGKQTIGAPAGFIVPATTNGCAALATEEFPSNDIDVDYLAFDPATNERARYAVPMPKGWNAGTLSAIYKWKHPAASTFDVVWKMSILSISNDQALDTAPGAAVSVTSSGGVTGKEYFSDETAAITASNTPAKQDDLYIIIERDAVADTLDVDAHLIRVDFFYTTDQAVDI